MPHGSLPFCILPNSLSNTGRVLSGLCTMKAGKSETNYMFVSSICRTNAAYKVEKLSILDVEGDFTDAA